MKGVPGGGRGRSASQGSREEPSREGHVGWRQQAWRRSSEAGHGQSRLEECLGFQKVEAAVDRVKEKRVRPGQ